MINSQISYILLAIVTVLVPIKLKCQHRFLLSISCFLMGASVITAIYHSNYENGKWIVVGLNSVGIMVFYLRYKLLASKQ